MRSGLFVTGTDTGVGKTIVAAAIIKTLQAQGIRACGMKPVETGCPRVGNVIYPSDGIFLKEAAGMNDDIEDVTPYRFETPAAPSLASEIEGRSVEAGVILQKFNRLLEKYDTVVVEGIGGLLVPLNRDYFVTDLIRELNLPLLVVSRPSLGTLNHTLLTVNYASQNGIRVEGIILNFSRPPDGSISEQTAPRILAELCRAPLIGKFPYFDDPHKEILKGRMSQYLDIGRLRTLMGMP